MPAKLTVLGSVKQGAVQRVLLIHRQRQRQFGVRAGARELCLLTWCECMMFDSFMQLKRLMDAETYTEEIRETAALNCKWLVASGKQCVAGGSRLPSPVFDFKYPLGPGCVARGPSHLCLSATPGRQPAAQPVAMLRRRRGQRAAQHQQLRERGSGWHVLSGRHRHAAWQAAQHPKRWSPSPRPRRSPRQPAAMRPCSRACRAQPSPALVLAGSPHPGRCGRRRATLRTRGLAAGRARPPAEPAAPDGCPADTPRARPAARRRRRPAPRPRGAAAAPRPPGAAPAPGSLQAERGRGGRREDAASAGRAAQQLGGETRPAGNERGRLCAREASWRAVPGHRLQAEPASGAGPSRRSAARRTCARVHQRLLGAHHGVQAGLQPLVLRHDAEVVSRRQRGGLGLRALTGGAGGPRRARHSAERGPGVAGEGAQVRQRQGHHWRDRQRPREHRVLPGVHGRQTQLTAHSGDASHLG